MFLEAFQKTFLIFFGLILLTYCATALVGPEKTTLIFYYGPEYEDRIVYNLSDATQVLQHPNFTREETHCYLHGYHENQDSESIHVIVDAYMKRGTVNLLTIDWAMAASENYLLAAVSNIKRLSEALADMTLRLYDAGLERESFTMVAHSLGAQLAGMTGRQIIKKTNGTTLIHKMAVLDPAYPLFFNSFFLKTVSKSDAEFLQAIHTDIGTYGQPVSLGHADFWPNGGRQGQPGCPQGFIFPLSNEDLCSHQRSWRFWAESVANLNGPKFLAFPSMSYLQFLLTDTDNLKMQPVEMGFNCPTSARGNFYLKTNSQPPFAIGQSVF